jgi:phage major head subunit gpT-like protein
MLNQSILTAASKTFRAIFFEGLEKGNVDLQALISLFAMEVTSTGDTEEYDWLGDVPSMEEWTSDRPLKHLAAKGFSLANKSWANGITVKAKTIRDDKLDLVRPRLQSLASKALAHKWELLLSLINSGETTLCYDGQHFLDTTHAEGSSGTQENLTTNQLDADAFALARKVMRKLKNDKGKLLYVRPTHLLVCPALEGDGREILIANRNAAGADNIWAGACQLLVVDGLDVGGHDNDKSWGLIDASKPFKPLLQQNRSPVQFRALENPTDLQAFMRDEFYYGADYEGNAAPAFWQTIHMSDGTGS